MPRTKQRNERGNAALQQRVDSAEAEAAALRRQCRMLGMHVWLLQRELSQAESETQAMHAASSRTKPGARRRARSQAISSSQNTTDMVGMNGLRIPSASASATPEMMRLSCSASDLPSMGAADRRTPIPQTCRPSSAAFVSSAASSESFSPSPEISPSARRPIPPVELRRDTPSSSVDSPPPPLVQLARDGSGGGGAKPQAAPQRPQALMPQAMAAVQQGSASSPSVSPQLLSAPVPMSVQRSGGASGSELFDRPHSGDGPLLREARSISSLAAGPGSGVGAGSPLGVAHDASVARPSRLAVGSLQEYVCSTLQEAEASASSTAAELDAAFLAGPRPEHAWTPCPGRAFHVRQPNYARTALKAPSLEAMYEVVAQDTFLCPDAKLPHVARLLDLPKEECLQRYGVPSNLVLSFLIPDYSPTLFASKDDGPGWTLVTVCRLREEAREQLQRGSLSPALRLWRDVVGAPEDSELRRRLKCICSLANPADIKVDKVTHGLIAKYNAKPFMCIKTGFYYRTPNYMALEVDVHRWGKLALNGWTEP